MVEVLPSRQWSQCLDFLLDRIFCGSSGLSVARRLRPHLPPLSHQTRTVKEVEKDLICMYSEHVNTGDVRSPSGACSIPVGSAGMWACGWHSHRSGLKAALRFWSSSHSARPHATAYGHWRLMYWWDDKHLRLWRTCTSLWRTSCGCGQKMHYYTLEEEINSTGGLVWLEELLVITHQNSPSSSTVMPRLPLSVSPIFDHSTELTYSKKSNLRWLANYILSHKMCLQEVWILLDKEFTLWTGWSEVQQ